MLIHLLNISELTFFLIPLYFFIKTMTNELKKTVFSFFMVVNLFVLRKWLDEQIDNDVTQFHSVMYFSRTIKQIDNPLIKKKFLI
jgi:hypothetical protein